jgi:two-component system, chemotaxis family, chemotaxis protein CheY
MAKTILIVDDSATMLMSVKNSLSLGGYQVETADNGQLAIDKLNAGLKPSLIITDINMPVMGGLEMIEKVRALPGCRFFPILTLTTESETAKRDEGRRLGATGWLVKPISGGDLLKVVKQLLPGS